MENSHDLAGRLDQEPHGISARLTLKIIDMRLNGGFINSKGEAGASIGFTATVNELPFMP
jgi:hypothetical protein